MSRASPETHQVLLEVSACGLVSSICGNGGVVGSVHGNDAGVALSHCFSSVDWDSTTYQMRVVSGIRYERKRARTQECGCLVGKRSRTKPGHLRKVLVCSQLGNCMAHTPLVGRCRIRVARKLSSNKLCSIIGNDGV